MMNHKLYQGIKFLIRHKKKYTKTLKNFIIFLTVFVVQKNLQFSISSYRISVTKRRKMWVWESQCCLHREVTLKHNSDLSTVNRKIQIWWIVQKPVSIINWRPQEVSEFPATTAISVRSAFSIGLLMLCTACWAFCF